MWWQWELATVRMWLWCHRMTVGVATACAFGAAAGWVAVWAGQLDVRWVMLAIATLVAAGTVGLAIQQSVEARLARLTSPACRPVRVAATAWVLDQIGMPVSASEGRATQRARWLQAEQVVALRELWSHEVQPEARPVR